MNKQTANRKPSPQPETEAETTSESMVAAIIDLPTPKGKAAAGGLTAISLGNREKLALKAQLMSEARQRLAEAADLYSREGETATEAQVVASEAQAVAAKAGAIIFKGCIAGAISPDEVSGLLGDIWGFKMKGDAEQRVPAGHPKASKTPAGQGEQIRKRIVRATQAYEFVTGGDAGRFFEGLEPAEVEPLVNELSEGNKTVWQVYDRLATIKREKVQRVETAYNAKAIAKIVSKLSEPSSVKILAGDAELLAAYAELKDVLAVIDEQLADVVSE